MLAVQGLAAGYGNKTVVTDVSFALAAGEVLALLGHNGAGKTTTLKSIMGLIPARAGQVLLNDQPIQSAPTGRRLMDGLRLLPEGRGVFADLGVAENIEVVAARNCTGQDDMFGPEDVYRLFPALAERKRLRAGSMSGGQQQMLALGLSILGKPRCLMLDEPSIGLAPNLVERMFDQIRDMCRTHGMAALLVEQNVSAAMRVADRLLIMNNGTVVFAGTPDEARATNVWHYF